MITLGNYAFKRLAMGLKSAGNTFCRFMHEVLRGVPNCFVYIDDIMIFSESEEDHWKHLSEVFNRLEHFGLILNKDKCVFAVKEVDFLEHRVDSQGVRPLETKVSAIRDFPKPRTVKDLRKFLGAINFYRSFIPNAGGILQPLDSLLTPGKGTKKPVKWSTTADVAFHAAKSSLAQAASLAFTISGARISLMTDASDVAVGATLQQEIDGHQQPLGFSPSLYPVPKGTIPHSIENYWPCTFLSSTFATFWKAALSLFTQTMLHSLTPFPLLLRRHQDDAFASSNSFRSSLRTFSM